MTRTTTLLLGAALALVFSTTAQADSDTAENGEKYLLRYHFEPGETVRWRVVHLAKIKTTVAGVSQTTETVSKSIKAWKVAEVADNGDATFENIVEQVDMRSKVTGRQEVRYNSLTDEEPPAVFEKVAESIGKRLSLITLNHQGKIVKRKDENVVAATPNKGEVTMPLPEEPIGVGETWSFPHDLMIPTNNGTVVKIKTQQRFTLKQVKNDVATVRMTTVLLTPIHDPAIESQVIQRQTEGTIRFDVKAGRILSQQTDLDKRVVGFAGKSHTSSLHYVTRFTEDIIINLQHTDEMAETPAETKTAAKPAEDTAMRK